MVTVLFISVRNACMRTNLLSTRVPNNSYHLQLKLFIVKTFCFVLIFTKYRRLFVFVRVLLNVYKIIHILNYGSQTRNLVAKLSTYLTKF